MSDVTATTVDTVLGPVPAADLGVVAVHESLLSVLPGAQFAYDITLDRAQAYRALANQLTAFRTAGGGTVVDSTGMFHGRDLALYESLARTTGVNIVASTGLGPEALLGGYFLTPQTNPPTPWPAEKFGDLFAAEITDGMVVPRVERRAPAGVIATATTRGGTTPTDESLVRGAARAALATGVAMSLRAGSDPIGDLELALDEGLAAHRVVVGDLDRRDVWVDGTALEIARRGAYVAVDHVGVNDDPELLTDAERMTLVSDLITAGCGNRILLSSNSVGVAVGVPESPASLSTVLTTFVPALKAEGVAQESIDQILVGNPRNLLTGGV